MNNAPRQRLIPSARTRTGFSLVEILVVLVVLVVGILAIVRLFPAGFIALRNAQNSTFADRLGQAALESLKQGQGTLPDAVYMYVDGANGGFNPNVAPDDLYGFAPDANGKNTSHQYGLLTDLDADINKQRYISNETVSVPAAHAVNGTLYPPLYSIAFGPVYLPTTTLPTGASTLPFLKVNSTPWTPQKGDSRVDPNDPIAATNPAIARRFTNAPDILSPTQGAYLADLAAGTTTPAPTLRPTQTAYLVDKDAGSIAVPTASYNQTFMLTVTRKVGGTTTQLLTVPALDYDTNTNLPTGYTGNWFSTTDPTGGGDPLPSTAAVGTPAMANPWLSVTLTRPFQYMGILPAPSTPMPFTADPYQYCLDADNIATTPNAQTVENMGVLAFNPVAGGQNGIAPLQAQVSYETLNWHVLHENLDVPSGGGTLKLVLDHLKRVGDVQFDGTIFKGLNTDAPTGSQYDLLMVDRDTGDIYGFRGTGGTPAAVEYVNGSAAATDLTPTYPLDIVDNGDDPTTATKPPLVLNYGGGRITLPTAFAGKHLRVFYSGDADWAVAVQKAPSTYTQAAALSDVSAFNTGTPNKFYVPTDGTTRIYFPACDAGKTVELDGVTCNVTDKNGVAQVRQAPQITEPVSLTPQTPGGTDYYVDLGPLGANVVQKYDIMAATTPPAVPNLIVNGVRGVSLRAIVIWHERNTWHTRATDTLLTRSQP